MVITSDTASMTEPGGIDPAMSKRSTARRSRLSLVVPMKVTVPAPQLLTSKFSPVFGSTPW